VKSGLAIERKYHPARYGIKWQGASRIRVHSKKERTIIHSYGKKVANRVIAFSGNKPGSWDN